MAGSERTGNRLLGTLRSADGRDVVRIEDRYDTGIDDLWSALIDPARLARWFGRVGGDLRLGGEFRLFVPGAELDLIGHVKACEPPRRLRVTTRETEESYQQGVGEPPFDEDIEATLTADGDQTILVIEVSGVPLEKVAFYGVGWQIHAENLRAHLAGHEVGDDEARWAELVPPYQELAADVS